ncbi:MAG: hypothetical protein A3H41_00225 [Omnitrophica WOR_2 bacterium RIFCSPLOWO2_02_FULL_45_28]|nr:MAG: hypothetical protein A3H41_00225 [Omnitrophica WOR_2 bacterium RIFCSPLOWO2_02_FULL_45_28]
MEKECTFRELVDIGQWQKIQEHFAEVIGATIRTIDLNGDGLTTASRPTRLCQEIMSSSPAGIAKCRECFSPTLIDLKANELWREGYQCHLGLHNFAIPVNLPDNQKIAYILVGPVLLGERQKPNKYRQIIEELGMDFDKFVDALIEIKVFSFSAIQSVLELLQEVISYIAEVGYHRFKLEKVIPLHRLSKMVYKFYTEKLLNALLDVSFNVLDGEFGSIMLFNEKTGELNIKIGRGIKKDIIKHTRLKAGEGIAGLAAQERKIFLVNDKVADERIKQRLERPEITSAVVAPIQAEDKLFGVMSVGTRHASDKFNSENIDILRQLVKLVAISFKDIPAI